jgi:hypothetical protein
MNVAASSLCASVVRSPLPAGRPGVLIGPPPAATSGQVRYPVTFVSHRSSLFEHHVQLRNRGHDLRKCAKLLESLKEVAIEANGWLIN